MEKNNQLRSSTLSDLPSLSRCHRAAFPESLASALGYRYCINMLSWYLFSNKTFLFHLEDEKGRCVGYCGGIIIDGALGTGSASGMAQHTFWHAIWAFFTHPLVLFHPELRSKWPVIWKNVLTKLGLYRRVHFSVNQKELMAKNPMIGLVVIGVDPAFHGKGFGSLLLQEFERRAVVVYEILKLQLTVNSNNQKAIRAYERNGWEISGIQGVSTLMTKNIFKDK